MRQTKRFAVVGSDARQAAAGRALARAGYTVGGVQQLPQADCILLPLPLEQSGLPLAQLLGGSLHVTGAYPAWEYRRESVLREKMAAVYEQQIGRAPKIEAIHAGLECGLFAGQLPGLDCVSFGPDLVDIHTAREKMSISSVQRTWKFLLGVLEALKD